MRWLELIRRILSHRIFAVIPVERRTVGSRRRCVSRDNGLRSLEYLRTGTPGAYRSNA